MSFNKRALFTRTGLSVAVAMSVLSVVAQAEDAQAEDAHQLDEIVVTAARTAQTVDETLAPVTVIDREQIERSQATSVTELLSQAPGVQIASSGGPGSMSSVYIRGTSTAQTLILMDGQKINTASSGSAPLEYINPAQIERIEIVRGPRSTLYGADAVGGVINIITRKGSGDPKLSLTAGIGSRNTGEYGVHFGGQSDNTRYSLGARLYETQGYDRTVTQYGFDADDDAYRNKSLSGSLSRDFGKGVIAGVNFAHFEGKSEYDVNSNYPSSTQGYPTSFFEETTVSAYVSSAITENWDSRLEAGYLRDNRDDKGAGSPRSTTNNRYSLSWVNDVSWLENQFITTGFDYSNDLVDTTSNYAVTERYNVGLFAQNVTYMEHGELQLGGRYDNNEAYGDKTTGSISWGVNLPHQMRLISSYGTAFRAPTFMDLYYPGSERPNLKPETAKNAEIELRGHLGDFSQWSVNLYQNRMSNMLIWDDGGMENVEDARIQGLEVSLATVLMNWDISTNASFLDPENKTTGKHLLRRAQQLFTLNLDRDFGRWSVGGTFRAQGSSWDDVGNTKKVAGFGTMDLRTAIKLTPELKTQFKVVNLMDKKYTTAKGFIDEPRGIFATLIWSPEL